ncbi:hypothetical protein ABW19_dt0201883 [Dactylella cylindrospora]|nr:hypothetical protein ABW19_dt0201883 [Dactylella cylindrospora]
MATAPKTLIPKIVDTFERRIHQKPCQISTPESEGAFNLLYLVTLPSPPPGFTSNEFFVPLAFPLHPVVKTRNEVGWFKYLQQHGDPELRKKIPKLLFYSDNTDELGYEYTALEKLPGETLCDIWEDIDPVPVVSAVVDVVLELRNFTPKLPTKWFGGFTPEYKPGPYVECTSYATDHITKHWAGYSDESYESLNLLTPFQNLAEYWKARLERDVRIVKKHKNCEPLRGSFLSMLESLPPIPECVEKVQPFLAHRDLILGNLLWDRKEQKITGLLDWEFSGMYALSDWNLGNTMWTTKPATKQDGKVTQQQLFELLEEELKRRGLDKTDEVFEDGTLEHSYAKVVGLSYWIVRKHVEREELEEGGRVQTWMKEIGEHLQLLVKE